MKTNKQDVLELIFSLRKLKKVEFEITGEIMFLLAQSRPALTQVLKKVGKRYTLQKIIEYIQPEK
jgi:hypothetical protein